LILVHIGWSAFNKFRPVIRRPTIQAKAKLNKPFIPAGATIVETKTITKEEREIEQQKREQQAAQAAAAAAAAKATSDPTQKATDNIDLGAIPFLTTADDVNGFRANQKSKVIESLALEYTTAKNYYTEKGQERKIKRCKYPTFTYCI
jgi:splicing factor 45